jgi:Ca2+ transporting ATPase
MLVDNVTEYKDIYKLSDPSVQFTVIFNAFVLMTLFNELNARKIHNERNIFEGLQNNKIFLIIWIGCFGLQIIIVNFGGIVFEVEPIDLDEWMWCLFFGIGSLLWGQVQILASNIISSIFLK